MKTTLNYPKSAAKGFFSKGLKNEFETAVVNKPSVFERLKFHCSNETYLFQNAPDFFLVPFCAMQNKQVRDKECGQIDAQFNLPFYSSL